MRSILAKILGLLVLLNIALWLFVLVTDDFVINQIREKHEKMISTGHLIGLASKPILLNENYTEFEKGVRLKQYFTDNFIPNAEKITVYRHELSDEIADWFKYYDGSDLGKYQAISVSELPPAQTSNENMRKANEEPLTQIIASRIFQYYKPIIDGQIVTDEIVAKRARFSIQSEILNSKYDRYDLRVLVPIRNGRETVAVLEAWDQYYVKDAYLGRNSMRLNLLIGMSVITLFLGLVLAFSIAFPLRRLSKRLDKKLVPDQVAVQMNSFFIKGMADRRDEIGLLYQNLVKLTQQVGHLFKEKEAFASEVSHELKNPLASIISYSENFEGGSEKDERIIRKIREQAHRMDKLISEISEAAIVDNDLVTKKRERLNLSQITKEIVEHYVETNESKTLTIEADIQSNVFIKGLPERLGQVIVNLLENAVSFTRPAGIIRVSLKKGWRSGTVIIVEDSGPGIREEFREAIFERFYTSRKGEAVIENASGLGLAIVKQIIDAHGGRISVGSSELGGAKFEIQI